MRLADKLRRRGFRLAYLGMRVYWFLTRPTLTGVKCVFTDGEQVLLVRHTYGRRIWQLPGGAVKRHERPEAAARREMEEELGITIDDWTPLGLVTGRLQYRFDMLHCFQTELPAQALRLDPGEIEAARWFKRSELPPQLGEYVRPILDRLPDSRSASSTPTR